MSRLAGLRHCLSFVFLVGVASSLFLACGGGDSAPGPAQTESSNHLAPKRLTFMAGFKPQANLPFVGAYVAQEKGFFQELNLSVDIRHAQSGEHLQLLLAGEVQVATANAAQVIQRSSEGLPLVSLALVGQKSEQGFAVGAGSGISSVADWAGKTFGYKGSVPVEFLAIAQANNLEPDRVKQVKVSFDPRVLSEGQVDILAVFISNEPGQLERIGYPVRVFDPSDFGIPALGLTYIGSRDSLQKDPEAIERFVRAALRGIAYAAEHPDEALDIVMKYAPQENRDQQRFMLTTELARAKTELTEKNGYGWQSREQWQALADALVAFGVIEKPVDISQVFTARFLGKSN
jgi:ABC-type nitrate/sulfonate/bicarbonate transport system substrate-binding protein